MASCKVQFLPFDRTVTVDSGISLLEAAGAAEISLNNLCGGDGVCGRCRMIVKSGKVKGDSASIVSTEETEQGIVLACLSSVESDLVVEIPESTRAGERINVNRDAARFSADSPGVTQRDFKLGPITAKVHVQLDEPSLESHFADFERISHILEKELGDGQIESGLDVLRKAPDVLRDNNFNVTAVAGRRVCSCEMIDIEGGDTSSSNHIVVVDVGTTTVVAHLVRTADMTTICTEACFNSQSVYGREVTARIISAEKQGVEKLQELIVQDINNLVSAMAEKAGIDVSCITGIMCSGNTTMTHFLLGLPPENIRREPFIAVAAAPSPVYARDVGLKIHPRGMLYTVPGIGSWVGGDLTAGILAVGLHEKDDVIMLIDVGTNGEVIVGGSDWIMACSASTGPALEGASVECGMMGQTGAIERVMLDDGEVKFRVIGEGEPKGICGSGIIDLVAVLLEKEVIDRSGRFVEGSDAAVEMVDGRGKYTIPGTEVFINQDDIDNIVTAKAAVFAATKIMLDRLHLGFEDVGRLYIAGGFGNYIDIKNAISIGLLPGLPLSKIEYAGNTSLWGAKLAALSDEAFRDLYEIRNKTTYFDLMGSSDYVEQFQQAQFLPHTHIELFGKG